MTSKIRRAIAAAGLSLGLAVAAIPASGAESAAPPVDPSTSAMSMQSVSTQGWGVAFNVTNGRLNWEKGKSWEVPPGNLVISTRTDKLVYQWDGNLVFYVDGRARWQSGTAGVPGGKLALQSDGNVVIYQMPGNIPRWQSGYRGNYAENAWNASLRGYEFNVNRHTIFGCWNAARVTLDEYSWVIPGLNQYWNSGSYCT